MRSSEVIRGHQRTARAPDEGRNQGHSEVISGHQRSSAVISAPLALLALALVAHQLRAFFGEHRHVARWILGRWMQSVAISRN